MFQETPKPQPSAIVRRVFETPAHLHCHRVHEARQFAQLPASARTDTDEQCGIIIGHVHSSLQGNDLLGAPQLHPPRLGGQELSGGQRECGEGGRLWTGQVCTGRPVHEFGRHKVPDQVGAA